MNLDKEGMVKPAHELPRSTFPVIIVVTLLLLTFC